jgi:hypothetical protein
MILSRRLVHGGETFVNAPAVDASAERDATYTRWTQSTSTAARTKTIPVSRSGSGIETRDV